MILYCAAEIVASEAVLQLYRSLLQAWLQGQFPVVSLNCSPVVFFFASTGKKRFEPLWTPSS